MEYSDNHMPTAQWAKPDPQMSKVYRNNNDTGSSFNVNDYNNRSRTNLNPNAATNPNMRRRFSMKLTQAPIDFSDVPGSAIPPLPFNSHSQIANISGTNINDAISIQSEYNPDQKYDNQNFNNLNSTSNYDNNVIGNSNFDYKKYDGSSHSMRVGELENNEQMKHNEFLNELSSSHFNPDKYVQLQLSSADAKNIDKFSKYMDDLNIVNDNAVKQSLSESTAQVINISETFKKTHTVLLGLKPKVSELTEILTQQLEEANEYIENQKNNTGSGDRSNINSSRNRQSVMLLQNKWINGIKKLYSSIDRVHDLLPPIPNRHIIIESLRWGELNSITCKPIHPVTIYVLNDSILIASRIRNSSKYSNNGSVDNSLNSKKSVRNIATNCWMIDKVMIKRCSEIKELKDLINNSASLKTNMSDYAESASDLTLSIKSIDSNQTFLFHTDIHSEFIRVFNAIQKAQNEVASTKRRSMRDSMSKISLLNINNSDSRHVSISGAGTISQTAIEKQVESEFKSCVSKIDEFLTASSLNLGLHRYSDCGGYLSGLNDELKNLKQIAVTVGIPESLLISKSYNTTKQNGNIPTPFLQQIHLIYNVKLASWKKLTDQLILSLLDEISLNDITDDSLKEYMDIFKILGKHKDAAEVYLDSRGRELADYVSMVSIGGYSGNGIASDSTLVKNNIVDRGLHRSNSSRLSGIFKGHSRRPSSIISSSTPEPSSNGTDVDVETEQVKLDSVRGISGEVITAYVKELSLVYMGFIAKIWDQWNECFVGNDQKNGTFDTTFNLRIIEWIDENIQQLTQSIQLALIDYERNGEIFQSCVKIMKDIFDELKDKQLNVDYLLEI